MAKHIVIFVAHSDDEVLGAGGVIAKYSQQGYKVHTIICSYGEASHPHLKPEVIQKTRVQEAERADKVLGGAGVKFLGLTEGKFLEEIEGKKFTWLVNRLKRLKPEKVFSHDICDAHPDHRAVNQIIIRARKKTSFELYTFHIWTFINRQQGKTPMLYEDISSVFKKKIIALHIFKSQISPFSHSQLNNLVYLGVYVKAVLGGIRIRKRYAEVFHKI